MIRIVDRICGAIVLLGLLAYIVSVTAPSIEGRLFPVVSPIEVHSPVPHVPPAYQYKWKGRAEKLRNCEFIQVEWYLGRRAGGRVRVSAEFLDPPQVRPAGVLEWERLVIALEQGAVISNSHADVIHKCPMRPWNTRTPFYDTN